MAPWWKPNNPRHRVACLLDEDPKFRCCGCCHVQTGTICLGVYNLVVQLMCMSVLMLAILHPDMLLDRYRGDQYPIDAEVTAPSHAPIDPHDVTASPAIQQLPTPAALQSPNAIQMDRVEGMSAVLPREMDKPLHDRSGGLFYSKDEMVLFTRRRVQSGDAHLALALVFGLMIITCLMIYGAIKSRPVYLLPFFCFQVFDFILACLTAVGHYTWLPNIHHAMIQNPDIPFRNHLMQMNGQWVALCILLLYVLALVVKAYLIGVVWAAYQYLHVRNAGIIRYTATETDGLLLPDGEPELLLPPDYETASKMPPAYPGPPPGYSSA